MGHCCSDINLGPAMRVEWDHSNRGLGEGKRKYQLLLKRQQVDRIVRTHK